MYIITFTSYGIHNTYDGPSFKTKKAAWKYLQSLINASRKAFYRRGYRGLKMEKWADGCRLTFGINLWESWAIVKRD